MCFTLSIYVYPVCLIALGFRSKYIICRSFARYKGWKNVNRGLKRSFSIARFIGLHRPRGGTSSMNQSLVIKHVLAIVFIYILLNKMYHDIETNKL